MKPILLFLMAAILVACGGVQHAEVSAEDCRGFAEQLCERTDDELIAPRIRPTDATLNAVLWTQQSVEFTTLALQTYRTAIGTLDHALADPTWTASPEQVNTDFSDLPPAVILDIDETVIDNSAYQGWLILNELTYSRETWNAWCDDEEAVLIPGALEYILEAHARGITPFYVTNRYAETRESTIRNLEALGLPFEDDYSNILLRGEQEDWGSDKGTRREFIGRNYRILHLVGDNFGDFLDEVEVSHQERLTMAMAYDAWWGERWFMLPNMQYGSWEHALFHDDPTFDAMVRYERKLRIMRSWSGPDAP